MPRHRDSDSFSYFKNKNKNVNFSKSLKNHFYLKIMDPETKKGYENFDTSRPNTIEKHDEMRRKSMKIV